MFYEKQDISLIWYSLKYEKPSGTYSKWLEKEWTHEFLGNGTIGIPPETSEKGTPWPPPRNSKQPNRRSRSSPHTEFSPRAGFGACLRRERESEVLRNLGWNFSGGFLCQRAGELQKSGPVRWSGLQLTTLCQPITAPCSWSSGRG